MGCCAARQKLCDVRAEQKWEYINLDDFHSTSCWTPLSYGVLYISLVISVAVYAVDTYTAVNLLAFARWSGQIKPYLPMEYSRWIFASCILLSFIILFFRWLRAIRVMKRGGVAESYLDPLALRVQSARVGKEGRGWKRFLVFAELTKGKKGADYVALFTHYSFEAWLRILLAEGPRQAINALTLYSVMQLNLLPTGDNAAKDGHTPVAQFFVNVGFLVNKSGKEQAVILFGMLFTLVIWVITIINLMLAVVLYLLFLSHHIPSSDGGLTGYCRRKINNSMDKIVRTKIERALRKENTLRARQAAWEGEVGMKQQPTLPNLGINSDEKPLSLSRQTTQTSLSEYSSRPGTATSARLTLTSDLGKRPPVPTLDSCDFRPGSPAHGDIHAPSASWASASNVSLIGGAGGMGYVPTGQMQGPDAASSAVGYRPGATLTRASTDYSQPTERSYTPWDGPPHAVGRKGRSSPGIYQTGHTRSGTTMSWAHTPGIGPSPTGSRGRQRSMGHDNRYFSPNFGYSNRPSGTPLSRSNTPGSVPAQAYGTGVRSSTIRSTTPANTTYSRSYHPTQAALPRLYTNTSSSEEAYRSYSAEPQSPARSAFTPRTLYRSYTQPAL